MSKVIFSEEEKELIDYLNVIWKRKWSIIIPTFLLVVIVGVYSFLAPKVWEIDAIIEPGKLFFETTQGQYEEVVVVDPSQLESQINEASYNNLIAVKLGIDLSLFPEIEAEYLRDTNLVRVSLREKNVEKGMNILNALYEHLKIGLDRKINVETKGIETQIENKKNLIKSKELDIKNKENTINFEKLKIEDKKNEIKTKHNRIKDKDNLIKTKENNIKLKQNTIKSKNLDIESKEIEKKRIYEEINTLNNKIKISIEREEAITEEMREVKDRINKIEEEQKNVLKKEGRKNALAILLYSNEIQNNLRYYNTLDEKYSNEKINQENMNLAIEEKKEEIKQIDNEIEQIKTDIEDVHTNIDDVMTEIDNIKTEIEDINTQIDNIENEIDKINNQINSIHNGIKMVKNEMENVKNEISLFEERKARYDQTQLIKKPTPSLYPVFPKKKHNILIACVLGLILFTGMNFFIEYIERNKI